MDKIVTIFGFLQSVVAPSRRNGSTDRAHDRRNQAYNKEPDDSPKAKVDFRQDSFDSSFDPTNGGLNDVLLGEKQLDRPKASAFTEPKLDTLRGEVRENKSTRTTCRISEKDEANVCNREKSSALLKVDFIPLLNTKAELKPFNDSMKDTKNSYAGKTSFETESWSKTENLPKMDNNPGLSSSKQHQNEKGKSKYFQGDKTLRGKSDLPNIFSSAGKSFVRTNQLSVFDRTSFRKTPKNVEKDISLETTATERNVSPVSGRKSRLEMPRVKRRSKKKTGKGSCEASSRNPDGQQGKDTHKNRTKDCAEEVMISHYDDQDGNSQENIKMKNNATRHQRPGTAFGRWIKRRSNAIAPAPLDGLTNDSQDCIQLQKQGRQVSTEETLEWDASEKHFFSSAATKVKTVLVSECLENVSLLVVKEKTHKEDDFKNMKRDDRLTDEGQRMQETSKDIARGDVKSSFGKTGKEDEPVEKVTAPYHSKAKKNDDSSMKTVREEEACSYIKTRSEEEPGGKATPPHPPQVQESQETRRMKTVREEKTRNYFITGIDEEATAGRIEPPSRDPVKRYLLKETSENVSLAALSDDPESTPQAATRGHPKLTVLRREDQEAFEMASGILNSPSHSSESCQKILVKQKLPSVNLHEEENTQFNRKEENHAKRLDTESPNYNKLGSRKQSSLKNSKNLPTLDRKQGSVKSLPKSDTGKPDSKPVTAGLPKIQKQRAGGSVPGIVKDNPKSIRVARKPLAFCQGTCELENSEASSSTAHVMITGEAKWSGEKPCLPPIKSERQKLAAEDVLEKRRKQQLKLGDDFGGWGEEEEEEEEEPEEVRRILEQPVTATLPNYPAHWEPVPNVHPPGRVAGGVGNCLGMLWKRPNKSFLSDSASEDFTADFEEESQVFHHGYRTLERPRIPQQLFVNYPFPQHDFEEHQQSFWCRALRNRSPPSTHALKGDSVDIEDVEDFV